MLTNNNIFITWLLYGDTVLAKYKAICYAIKPVFRDRTRKVEASTLFIAAGYPASTIFNNKPPTKCGSLAFNYPQVLARENPNSISVKREAPLHITILPGGGSFERAR